MPVRCRLESHESILGLSELSPPESKQAMLPNLDTQYSLAWLDLTKADPLQKEVAEGAPTNGIRARMVNLWFRAHKLHRQ